MLKSRVGCYFIDLSKRHCSIIGAQRKSIFILENITKNKVVFVTPDTLRSQHYSLKRKRFFSSPMTQHSIPEFVFTCTGEGRSIGINIESKASLPTDEFLLQATDKILQSASLVLKVTSL